MALEVCNAFFHPFHQRDKERFELRLNQGSQKIPHFLGYGCIRAIYGVVRAIVGIAGAIFFGFKYLWTNKPDDKKRATFTFVVEIPAGLVNVLRAVAEITWYIDKWAGWTEKDTLTFCDLNLSDIVYIPDSYNAGQGF